MRVAELRQASIEQKFQQLCALFASWDVFPPDPDREREASEPAARWRRIRDHYGE